MVKTLHEIETALTQEYSKSDYTKRTDITLKQIGGFDYIPWNNTTALANKIFGPLGWSSQVVDIKQAEIDGFTGWVSTVRVLVYSLLDDGTTIHTSFHDGVGFATDQAMGNKNPMDTASKAAKSDGVSTACKHFGDIFGLFLYDKEETNAYERQAPQTGTWNKTDRAPQGQTKTPAGNKPPISDKQVVVLRNKGFTNDQINVILTTVDWKVGKEIMQEAFAGEDAAMIMVNHGLVASGPRTGGGMYDGMGLDDLDNEHPF